jgi:hypothetical protein
LTQKPVCSKIAQVEKISFLKYPELFSPFPNLAIRKFASLQLPGTPRKTTVNKKNRRIPGAANRSSICGN